MNRSGQPKGALFTFLYGIMGAFRPLHGSDDWRAPSTLSSPSRGNDEGSLVFDPIGGTLAILSDVPKDGTPFMSLQIYSEAFLTYGLISLVLAGVSMALIPYLRKLIGLPPGPIPTPKR